jgi:hypothetical protein
MTHKILVAMTGDENDTILTAKKTLGIAEVLVLTLPGEQVLQGFESVKLKDATVQEIFRRFAEIAQSYGADNVIVNASSATKSFSGILMSAAFAHDMDVIVVEGKVVKMLPSLRFRYETPVTEKKLQILKSLLETPKTVEDLATRNRMSPPLVAFHMNGNRKSKGLVQMGLVQKVKQKGICNFSLSTLGELLLNGYVRAQETA